jgi:hypothetical protein
LSASGRVGGRAAHFLGLLALYSLATAIFFWPWIRHVHSALIGPPEDNMQDFWSTYYVAVTRDQTFFFTNLLRFPEGTPLHYHAFAYPKVFAIAALSRVVGTDLPTLVTLQNLSLLASFPIAAVGAFYLVRHLTGHVAGALLGGFVFAFNPSHIEQVMHHASVSSIEFIPFFVLAFVSALPRRTWLGIGMAIACYALSALSSWYYLFFIGYFMVFHLLYTLLRREPLSTTWGVFAAAVCLGGTLAVLTPLLGPMIRTALVDGRVYAGGHDMYVADVIAYVAFPRFHALSSFGEAIYRRLTGNVWEATVYLGMVNLAVLAWVSVFAKGSERRLVEYGIVGMIVFAVVASGNTLHVLGHGIVPMPGQLLSSLPLVANVRAPSRAIVFVYLFMAIVIGQAVAVAWRYRQRAAVRVGLTALAALIVLDFYPVGALAITPVDCSPGLATIRDDRDRDFGVLNLPNGQPMAAPEAKYYMLQQACHGRPICGGIVSRNLVVTLRDQLETRDLESQRRQLSESKVKYIVIDHPKGSWFRWRAEDGSEDEYRRVYPIVYRGPDVTVLRVY